MTLRTLLHQVTTHRQRKNGLFVDLGAVPSAKTLVTDLNPILVDAVEGRRRGGEKHEKPQHEWQDPWQSLHEKKSELDRSDVYTLRRIVPKDRGLNWD